MRVFHRRAWPDYKRQEEFLKEVADELEGKGRVNEVNGNFQGGGGKRGGPCKEVHRLSSI